MIFGILCAILLSRGSSLQVLPAVTLRSDDTEISRSCRVVIPKGTTITDRHGDGVIQITASGIVVQFVEGAELCGAAEGTTPDAFKGIGIRIAGHKNVTILGGRIRGYWCAIEASDADGLVLEGVDASDNRRARLRSTPAAEDAGDWLWPHANDGNEWLARYGAAISIEGSSGVTVRRCRARACQNGLILDRVDGSQIYDNDFSFLSGWGIALWRSSGNVLSRNAVDFCVRGYSHGVYNRGQDSAGLLVFEQCSGNVFAENSATHCGDGFFGFAGREALGEEGSHEPEWYRRRGNNDNLLTGNDFSYAAAHGIEMTFSFGNRFIGNRLVGNAICGVWGGYSQDTLIAGNTIEENGALGYGLERGGVNIEHGRGNRIIHNTFRSNRCGVHLWWDPDEDLGRKPWAKANGTASTGNLVAANRFEADDLVFHFRGPSDVTIGANTIRDAKRQMEKEPESEIARTEDPAVEPPPPAEVTIRGESRPVGARSRLHGRASIIMTEWGPWDHETPLVRLVERKGGLHLYDLHRLPEGAEVEVRGDRVQGARGAPAKPGGAPRYAVMAEGAGVFPYTIVASGGGFRAELKGTIVSMVWDATFFSWPEEIDPREQPAEWHALAKGEAAVSERVSRLAFKYASGGPGDLGLSEALTGAGLGGDRFGMIARTRLPLGRGVWRFSTLSDDGVRVTVDGKAVIDNWTWHAPARDSGTLTLDGNRTVEIIVEYFEIDGYAILELDIAPAMHADG